MYCNYCRALNPDDSSYCSSCGRTIESPSEQAQNHPQIWAPTDAHDAPIPRDYGRMDDDELAQLKEAYQKMRTLVPPDLQRELELRTHSREAKPKNAIHGGPYTTTNGNMTATKMSVLELIGWVALAALFVHDWIMWHPSIGLASLVGFLVGLMFDLRFSVLLVCLLLLEARRHKRNFPKEPTLKV